MLKLIIKVQYILWYEYLNLLLLYVNMFLYIFYYYIRALVTLSILFIKMTTAISNIFTTFSSPNSICNNIEFNSKYTLHRSCLILIFKYTFFFWNVDGVQLLNLNIEPEQNFIKMSKHLN